MVGEETKIHNRTIDLTLVPEGSRVETTEKPVDVEKLVQKKRVKKKYLKQSYKLKFHTM